MNQIQKEIYESLDEHQWKTALELQQELNYVYGRNYKQRRLRELIKECRMLFKENRVSLLIIKSNRGYKLSNDYDEIYKFSMELIETGKSMFREGEELLNAAKRTKNESKQCLAIEDFCKDTLKEIITNNKMSGSDLVRITKLLLENHSYISILNELKKMEKEKRDSEV